MVASSQSNDLILILGESVTDVVVHSESLNYDRASVRAVIDGQAIELPYEGEPIFPGEKRYLPDGAFPSLPLATKSPGGGVFYTTRQLARLLAQNGRDCTSVAVDIGEPSGEMSDHLGQCGARVFPLGLHPNLQNVVVTDQNDRVILKSKPRIASEDDVFQSGTREILGRLLDRARLLVINSPKSAAVTRAAVELAEKRGVPIFSVLTPSLSAADRLNTLIPSSRLCVSNLAEFAELASAAGIDCPREEQTADLVEVGRAIENFAADWPIRAMVVTLGERGCLVWNRDEENVHLVEPLAEVKQKVTERLSLCGELKVGCGDGFVACLAFARGLRERAGSLVADCVFACAQMAALLAGDYEMARDDNFQITPLRTGAEIIAIEDCA